jgi:hypothetical protein
MSGLNWLSFLTSSILRPLIVHRALGGVFEAHLEAGMGLLGIGFERRARQPMDQRDFCRLVLREGGWRQHQRRGRSQRSE